MAQDHVVQIQGGGGGVHAPTDRRGRKRAARRARLLDLAAEIVEDAGVAGLTMAALAEAADYAPASLYTYFASRSALVAAVQERALVSLGAVAERHLIAKQRNSVEPLILDREE